MNTKVLFFRVRKLVEAVVFSLRGLETFSGKPSRAYAWNWGMRVVVLACGTGTLTFALAEHAERSVFFGVTPFRIAACR